MARLKDDPRRKTSDPLRAVFISSWSYYATGGEKGVGLYRGAATPDDAFDAWKADGCPPLLDFDRHEAAVIAAYQDMA